MRTDGHDKRIFAFRNFANAPKIVYDLDYCSFVLNIKHVVTPVTNLSATQTSLRIRDWNAFFEVLCIGHDGGYIQILFYDSITATVGTHKLFPTRREQEKLKADTLRYGAVHSGTNLRTLLRYVMPPSSGLEMRLRQNIGHFC